MCILGNITYQNNTFRIIIRAQVHIFCFNLISMLNVSVNINVHIKNFEENNVGQNLN